MEVKFLLLTIIVCTNLLSDTRASCVKSKYAEIKESIFCNYDKFSLPSKNKTIVTVRIIPELVEYLDTKRTMRITVWIGLEWLDRRLHWDYRGNFIRHIDVDPNMIWTPDVLLFNWIDESPYLQNFDRTFVFINGRVFGVSKRVLKAHCEPDFTNWPFDENTCQFLLTSKLYRGHEMDYKLPANRLRMSDYMPHPEWELLDHSAKINSSQIDESDKYYSTSIILTFKTRRSASVLVASYVTPAFAIVALSAAVFWLNPESSQRIFVICMIVLLQCLDISYLSFKIHSNGTTLPKIVRFYSGSLILSTVLFVLTISTRCMVRWSSNPSWLQSLSNIIAKNKIIQLILLTRVDPNETGDYESMSLVSKEGGGRQWRIFAKILNRVLFMLILPIYIILFLHFII